MKVAGVIGRALLVLIGIGAAASLAEDVSLIAAHRLAVGPELTCSILWDAWIVSWIVASVWSRRVVARPAAFQEVVYWLLPAVGFGLLAFGSIATNFSPLWAMPPAIGWALAVICGAGLLLTWWARIALGSLWSGSVSRKEDHRVVQSGPYLVVRHPIYTGVIVASLAHVAVIGQAANLAGALVMTLGFWLKARFEERFLSEELGAAAYAEYRRHTPMLIPFWPLSRPLPNESK